MGIMLVGAHFINEAIQPIYRQIIVLLMRFSLRVLAGLPRTAQFFTSARDQHLANF